MIVKLRRGSQRYPDLSLRQPYVVIGIESDDYRILNDVRRYLYPHSLFRMIDAHEPEDWISAYGEYGEHYAYPVALNAARLFRGLLRRQVKGCKNVLAGGESTPRRLPMPPSAEAIARRAEQGKDVSHYFTNRGRMMKPIEPIPRRASTLTSQPLC